MVQSKCENAQREDKKQTAKKACFYAVLVFKSPMGPLPCFASGSISVTRIGWGRKLLSYPVLERGTFSNERRE